MTVFATHHAVFFIAEIGGAEPQRAVLLVEMATFGEAFVGGFDQVVVGQRPLGKPAIVIDTESMQVVTNHVDEGILGEIEHHAIVILA